MKRVVVTGMGAITPIGNSVEEFWKSVKENKVGIDEITKFDTTDYAVKLAAEVKGFDPKEKMGFRQAKRMSAFSQYAVCAAKEAMVQSGIDMAKEDPYRVGVSVGSGIGGMKDMEEEHGVTIDFSTVGPAETSAFPASFPVYFTKFLLNLSARSFAFVSHSEASAYVSRGSRIAGSTPVSSVGTSKLKIGIFFVGALLISPLKIASIIPRVSLMDIRFPVPFHPVFTR